MQIDKEEMDSYRQREFFDERKSSSLGGTTIFFSVVAAIIFCWFLKSMYEEWQIGRALAIVNEQVAMMEAQTKNELRKMQIRTEAFKAQNEERIQIKAEQNELLRIQKHDAELKKQAVFEAQLAAKNAKGLARKSFYKPTAGCEYDNPDRDLIKCGNDYARASRKFKENWAKNN